MRTLLAAAVLLAMTGSAYAEVNCDPGTVGSLTNYCKNKGRTIINQPIGGGGTAVINGSGNSSSSSVAQSVAYGGLGGSGGEGGAGGTVVVAPGAFGSGAAGEVRYAPQAPDINAYPTAPCRISVGVSASWLGGSAGVGSSVVDENCQRLETSRHLRNIGLADAAQQMMCLNPEAKQALEATGFKCLISGPAAPEPRVTP